MTASYTQDGAAVADGEDLDEDEFVRLVLAELDGDDASNEEDGQHHD